MTGILSDNGPEFTGKDSSKKVTQMALAHHRTPLRSLNLNAVRERFHSTVLSAFFRPHLQRGRDDDNALLDLPLQAWIVDDNQNRRNQGDYMRGRTPSRSSANPRPACGKLPPEHQPERPRDDQRHPDL